MGLKQYSVSACVTISLNAKVYAKSKADARRLAAELEMPTIYEDKRYTSKGESHDEWRTSGELDGVAQDIKAQLIGDDDGDYDD